MRIMGIDYGEVRTGIALSDELGITAQGLETINSNGNDKKLLARIEEIIKEYNVDTIVVGMPLLLNGDKSERAKRTEDFIHKLKCRFNKVKIDTVDERLTTIEAHRTMNDLDIDKRKKRSIVDTISAVYILEIYMEKQKNNVAK